MMENGNLTYNDFSVICRICLGKKYLQPFEDPSLLTLFESVTDIKVDAEEKLPRNVCQTCVNQLEDISCFISLSKNNNTILTEILNEHNIKEPYVVDSVFESDVQDDPPEYLDYSDDYKCEIKNEASVCNLKKALPLNSEGLENVNKKNIRHSTKKQPSECEVCGESFSTKSKLTEHQKKNINCRTRQYKCMNCEKSFFTKFRLKLHMRSHTKETPFECKICFKKFRHSPNLKRHDDIVHKGLKPFKCDVCGKEYSRQATRNEHMYSHSGERPYICVYCGKSFRTYSSHFSHMYCHKINNGQIPENKIKARKWKKSHLSELQCNTCKKSFSSKSSMLQHLQLHGEKQFLCTTCGKTFTRKRQLQDHCKVHTGEKPYTCKYCEKDFRLMSGYKNHILVHTGEKPYQCKMCLKTFVQSIHLRKHMRIHTGEKPYSCTFCGKCFAQNCNLKVHIRTHTGETPYICSFCGIGFYDSSNMKKHMKGHTHLDQNEINKGTESF